MALEQWGSKYMCVISTIMGTAVIMFLETKNNTFAIIAADDSDLTYWPQSVCVVIIL